MLEKIKDGGDSCFRDISRTSVKQSVPDPPITVFNWERNLSIDLTEPGRGLGLTLTGIEIRGILSEIRLTQTKVLEHLQLEW